MNDRDKPYCSLCRRDILSEQDIICVSSFLNVCTARTVVHLACFRIRVCASKTPKKIALAECQQKPMLQENTTCGYCQTNIGQDDDYVVYNYCNHKTVHFTCVQTFDYVRKVGCPLCYRHEQDNKSMVAWKSQNTKGKKKQIHSLLNCGTVSVEAAQLVYSTTSAAVKPTEARGMAGNNIVQSFKTKHAPRSILEEYNENKSKLNEPSFSTPFRQLVFELNFDDEIGNKKHIQECKMVPVLSFLGPTMHFADAVALGLTQNMVMYNKQNIKTFVDYILCAKSLKKSDLPTWNLSFIYMIMAGVDLSYFVNKPNITIDDLYLIDFNLPVFYAAGGTDSELALMFDFILKKHNLTLEVISPQFSAIN